jgi:hypothetical protein
MKKVIPDELRIGDARCKFSIDDNVMKIETFLYDPHKKGDRGVITGSMQDNQNDLYLVKFQGECDDSFEIDTHLILCNPWELAPWAD